MEFSYGASTTAAAGASDGISGTNFAARVADLEGHIDTLTAEVLTLAVRSHYQHFLQG